MQVELLSANDACASLFFGFEMPFFDDITSFDEEFVKFGMDSLDVEVNTPPRTLIEPEAALFFLYRFVLIVFFSGASSYLELLAPLFSLMFQLLT